MLFQKKKKQQFLKSESEIACPYFFFFLQTLAILPELALSNLSHRKFAQSKRFEIIKLKKRDGVSQRVGISSSTVIYIYSKYLKSGKVEDFKQPGKLSKG